MDRVINAAQELPKSINTSILQSALLAQNLQFTIEKERFVQIVHVSANYWITIANNGCTGGEIMVYDSLGHSDFPEEIKQQIAALIFSSVNKITLTFQAVQRQQDCSSCGLFAVAFATSLCFGSDPSTVPLTRKVTKLARRSRDTRERLAGDCLNVIAREGSRALESLISVLARQYNSRVVPRELSSFAREGAISICMPVSYYPACGYPR